MRDILFCDDILIAGDILGFGLQAPAPRQEDGITHSETPVHGDTLTLVHELNTDTHAYRIFVDKFTSA